MSSSKPPSSLRKGKDRATASDDFDAADLNQVITYRHLHSHNLGVKDPFRVIALCDSDAFYAACEQVRLGIDPSLPLVVLQWDSIIAVNYPARKFGISRMNKVKDALKQCPHLKVVHVATYKEGEAEPGYWDDPDTLTHKVSLDFYRRESWKVYHMFKEGLPTGEIEKASIDEAFIDFTKPVREELLQRYPYLATVPPDAPNGKDSPLPPPPPISWNELGTVIPVNPSPPKLKTEYDNETGEIKDEEACTGSVDGEEAIDAENKLDGVVEEDDSATTWHDVALSIAAEFMGQIRRDIHMKLGYTTSAGIARNKFLAKLTASYRKPNGQSILRDAAIPNYLKPMPFQKIRFLGGKLGVALAEEYDVSLVSDLLPVSLDEMQRKFGEESIWIWEILRGIDRTEVKERPPITKSMLASKNLPRPIVKASEGHHWIRVLAAELALRLREARESIPALWPKSIVLHVRQGYDSSRSKQAPFPFVRDITVDGIAHAGDKLWKELMGTDATRKSPLKVTNVQLSFSGIESMETGQRMIEGFFLGKETVVASTAAAGRQGNAEKGGMPVVKRRRTNSDDGAGPSRQRGDDVEGATAADQANTATISGQDRFAYTCSRCGHRVSLPSPSQRNRSGDSYGNVDNDIVAAGEECSDEVEDAFREALKKLQREHDDYHFAQDLQNEGGGNTGRFKLGDLSSRTSGTSGKGAANKKRKQAEGKPTGKVTEIKSSIAKFFVQK